MNRLWCTIFANTFIKKYYPGINEIPIYVDNLLDAFGMFIHEQNHFYNLRSNFVCIIINLKNCNNHPIIVMEVLMHELVHYTLFAKGYPHNDGDLVFEDEWDKFKIL